MKNLCQNISKVILFAILSVYATSAQNTITIDNGPQSTTTYKTLQDAVINATAGDIIYVQPSATTYGAATIDKALTIIGRSHSEPSNISLVSTLTINSSNVTIKGLQTSSISVYSLVSQTPITDVKLFECLGAISAGGITISRLDIRVDGLEIRGCVITGITCYPEANNIVISNNVITSTVSMYSPSQIVLANNIFRASGNISIQNNGLIGETLNLSNSMFISNSGSVNTAIFTGASGKDFNLSNNLTYNFGTGDYNFVTSGATVIFQNNTLLNTDPLFTNIDAAVSRSMAGTSSYLASTRIDDDLTLQAGSAKTGGVGGLEIGIFNNGFNYKYLGNPRGLPTLDIISYDGTVAKDGNINVTIKAKAN
jgi:hypothetical protein